MSGEKDTPPSYIESIELPPKTSNGTQPETFVSPMSKNQIIKNVAVVSIGFLFLFTAFQSMSNLQSSLNKELGVGSGSIAVLYGALIVSCMFVPPILIARLGCKWTIPIAMGGYVLYMAANFYAIWGLMAPAAIILGLGAAPLWSAKCTYLTQVGVWYSKLTGATEDAVINRFFGIFFMIFQTSQIWGNLISSEIFSQRPDNSSDYLNKSAEELALCGANYCPQKGNETLRPTDEKVYIVCGIYTGFAVVAIIIVSVFLDKIVLDKEEDGETRKISPRLLIATFKHLIKSTPQKLLIPLTIYSGVEQGFIGGTFTRAYVSCSLGIWNIGYIMIVYGVVDAICSFGFGRLVQYVGHIPFFVLAFLVHGACQITFLLWGPTPDQYVIFFVLAAFWGMGDAVIQTQINALYGFLFTDNTEAAFANYRLWESVGFVMVFGYNDYLCANMKLYICIGFLVVGMFGYGIVEVKSRRYTKGNINEG
ncbi:protein unc-93 homolog A-like isoform X2 [Gigantopelta aegis]|uniref:protein unc-93 homolog A-like isoform X2 n=1 Tax=Gigantopelta aegis TaxID=1735272 RepID=UPI001B88BC01|nr:protein unc-93 homolog A-like isoform X2 [Gigantopelta aegis]